MTRIVVGDDESQHARYAVREALVMGRELRLPVVVVRAFSMKEAAFDDQHPTGAVDPMDEVEAREAARLREHLTPLLEEFADVTIEVRAEQGNPATVLLREAEDARFVVVGSRGLGGLSRLLGSVSEKVVVQSKSPVLVVPEDPGV